MEPGKGFYSLSAILNERAVRPRFPVDFHLKQAVGALTLHTGVGAVLYTTEPAAISCVAKQTILMRRAQKNEQERQPIFVMISDIKSESILFFLFILSCF